MNYFLVGYMDTDVSYTPHVLPGEYQAKAEALESLLATVCHKRGVFYIIGEYSPAGELLGETEGIT